MWQCLQTRILLGEAADCWLGLGDFCLQHRMSGRWSPEELYEDIDTVQMGTELAC